MDEKTNKKLDELRKKYDDSKKNAPDEPKDNIIKEFDDIKEETKDYEIKDASLDIDSYNRKKYPAPEPPPINEPPPPTSEEDKMPGEDMILDEEKKAKAAAGVDISSVASALSEGSTDDSIKEQLDKLRDEYINFKDKRPGHSSEDIVNKFILLKEDCKTYKLEDHLLDREALHFQKKYTNPKIKTIQVPRTPHTFVEDSELAKTLPSGSSSLSDVSIKIKDFNDDLKSFIAINPVAWICGGIATDEENGSKNDVDILISIPTREELEKIVMFRIARMVTPEIRKRIQFLPDGTHSYVGPFTSNLPLFRLSVERIPDAEVVKMAEEEKRIIRIRSEEAGKRNKEALKAIEDDKITPSEYWKPSKPLRGMRPGEKQSIESFLDIYEEYYSYPSLSSKKLDGERLLVSKVYDDITIFSEDGSKLEKLKNLKEQLKKLLPSICVIEGELESWDFVRNLHNPRESVNTRIENDDYVFSIFECLYFKGEIPDELHDEIKYFDDNGVEAWKEKYL